ncbi:MAG TPA: hypothetical protein VIO94_16630 [Phenylobacterium sp.]
MPKFLAVFTGSEESRKASGWDDLSEADRSAREAKGMQAWGDWMQRNAAIVADQGGPLGATKKVGKSGVSDVRNNLAGYTVVEADSHEAAARLFENHPHFAIFPGDGVEIMPLLPIPGAPT